MRWSIGPPLSSNSIRGRIVDPRGLVIMHLDIYFFLLSKTEIERLLAPAGPIDRSREDVLFGAELFLYHVVPRDGVLESEFVHS